MKRTKLLLLLPFAFASFVGCSNTEDLFAPVASPEVINSIDTELLFSKSTQGIDSFYSKLTFSIDNNVIYTAGRNGNVYAIDAKTANTLWSVNLDREEENRDKRSARLSGGVSVNDNLVLVGSENGYLYALNKKDGSLKWKSDLRSEILSRPVFSQSGDKIFVTDSRDKVICLNSSDGSINWEAGDNIRNLSLRAKSNAIAVGNEYLLVGQANGRVTVYLQENGSIVNIILVSQSKGTNELSRINDVASTPLLIGSHMYAVSYQDGQLIDYDFNLKTVVKVLGYSSSNDLAVDDNNLVITDDQGYVYCIDRNTGAEIWSNRELTYRQTTAPCIYGDYVVVSDYEGIIYFLSIYDGSIKSKISFDSEGISSKAQVYDGYLYILGNSGKLGAFKTEDISLAKIKEDKLRADLEYAALGVNLMADGVDSLGIYVPTSITQEQLEQRRASIKRAIAEAQRREEAQRRAQMQAYQKAKQEYEEYKRRISGFGLAPQAGVTSSNVSNDIKEKNKNEQNDDVNTNEEQNKENLNQKAAGFGL